MIYVHIILMTVIHLTGNLSLLCQALSKLLFKDLCSLNFSDLDLESRIDFDFDYFNPNNRTGSLYWRDPRDYTEIEDYLNVRDCGYETLTVPC